MLWVQILDLILSQVVLQAGYVTSVHRQLVSFVNGDSMVTCHMGMIMTTKSNNPWNTPMHLSLIMLSRWDLGWENSSCYLIKTCSVNVISALCLCTQGLLQYPQETEVF